MLRRHSFFRSVITIGLMAAILPATGFTAQSDLSLSTAAAPMVKSADFIFQGTVQKVEYRHSAASGPGQTALPHTFVTFRIERVIKGKAQGPTVTLRFLGGHDREDRIMYPSEFPLFDVGDTDMLFVKDNGQSACPLVGCAAGRMRSIKGKIYDSDGREVILTPENRIAFGKSRRLPEILTDTIAHMTIKKEIIEEPADRSGQRGTPKGRHLDPESLAKYLEGAVNESVSEAERNRLPAVATQDPDKPFSIAAPEALTPPGPANPQPPPTATPNGRDRTPEDEREREAFEKGGGNPVLPK